MSRHIDDRRDQIFRNNAEAVKKKILAMVASNSESIYSEVKQVISALSKDYRSCLEESRLASPDERALKAKVAALLQGEKLSPCLAVGDPGIPAKSEPVDTDVKVKAEPKI